MKIDKRAIVSPDAVLGEGVEIGPYSIIGDNVKIGNNVTVGSFVSIDGWTDIGSGCKIYNGAIIGSESQDLKYKGDRSYVVVGDNSAIREYVTINRSSFMEESTVIGEKVVLMAYVHVAHDCNIGDEVVIGNSVGLSGHVQIGNKAVLGGFVGIHQFVRVGRLAMVGGYSKLVQDIVPFMMVDGNPATVYGINFEGLRRNNISSEIRKSLKTANKLLFRTGLNISQATDRINSEVKSSKEIEELVNFLKHPSKQGILTKIRECDNFSKHKAKEA